MDSLEQALKTMAKRGKSVEALIVNQHPELIGLFQTYQNEAIQARRLLHPNLIALQNGAKLLEIGGGILALAIQLESEGFDVTTVEPIGDGFTGISFMMQQFLETANEEALGVSLIRLPIEECVFEDKFDFAFSINVMEHLQDPLGVLGQILKTLSPSGVYRFFCPNYDFPYEPHFGKLLWRRKNHSFYLDDIRAERKHINGVDSLSLYNSLNFITLKKVLRFCSDNNLELTINRFALHDILRRAIYDSALKSRHRNLAMLAAFIQKIGLLRLSKYVPPRYQPVMDLSLTV
jgi:SAM-dependent methyltransferase